MFTVQVTGHGGVEAEFVVPSPVLALDLALRAVRAGLSWRAAVGVERRHPLSLPELREMAARHAVAEPTSAHHLHDVVRAETRAAAARLN